MSTWRAPRRHAHVGRRSSEPWKPVPKRGVDPEVGRRQPGRSVGDVDHPHGRARTRPAPRTPPDRRCRCCHFRRGRRRDARTSRPSSAAAAATTAARPLESSTSTGSGAAGVDRRHLRRRDDRDHRPRYRRGRRPVTTGRHWPDRSARGATASGRECGGWGTGGSGRTGLGQHRLEVAEALEPGQAVVSADPALPDPANALAQLGRPGDHRSTALVDAHATRRRPLDLHRSSRGLRRTSAY